MTNLKWPGQLIRPNAGTGTPYLTANDISWLTDPVTDPVVKAYLAYFGRPADVGGFLLSRQYHQNLWRKHRRSRSVVRALGGIPVALQRHDDRSKVSAVYHQLFGRDPDASGLQYWIGVLDSGRVRDRHGPYNHPQWCAGGRSLHH